MGLIKFTQNAPLVNEGEWGGTGGLLGWGGRSGPSFISAGAAVVGPGLGGRGGDWGAPLGCRVMGVTPVEKAQLGDPHPGDPPWKGIW